MNIYFVQYFCSGSYIWLVNFSTTDSRNLNMVVMLDDDDNNDDCGD